MYRDIKLNNFLFERTACGTPCLKLIDFGLSKYLQEHEMMDKVLGSPPYIGTKWSEVKWSVLNVLFTFYFSTLLLHTNEY